MKGFLDIFEVLTGIERNPLQSENYSMFLLLFFSSWSANYPAFWKSFCRPGV